VVVEVKVLMPARFNAPVPKYANALAPVPPFVIGAPMFVVPEPANLKVRPVLSFESITARVLNESVAPPVNRFVNNRSPALFCKL
jgi:hypothetical protein